MVDALPDITKIGQQALELPTNVLNTEVRQFSEKMGVLTTEIQKLGTTLPVIGAGLPALPPLPGMAPAAAPEPEPTATRSAAVQGVRSTKSKSYMAGVK